MHLTQLGSLSKGGLRAISFGGSYFSLGQDRGC